MTVETSIYGSELVATRLATELVQESRYKLRIMGVPIEEPTPIYGDNMAVVFDITVPSSQLKKYITQLRIIAYVKPSPRA
jgi:hypothetical protein